MTFDFNVYIDAANKKFLKEQHQQRYGQFLMNYLHQTNPEIVIPENVDPFYDNGKVPDFLNYLWSISA